MKPAEEEAGFTLIELMVSLAILGLVAAMLASGVRTGLGVWHRVADKAEGGDAVAAAQFALRAVIERTQARTSFRGSRPSVAFIGDRDSMAFVGPAALAERPAAARDYRLTLGNDGALSLWSANSLAVDADTPDRRRVLLHGASRLDIAYFGTVPPDNRPQWRPVWRGMPRLPDAISIRIGFPAGDPRQWPVLIVRPVAGIDSACIVDVASGRCRGR